MIKDVIMEMMNRMPAAELAKRSEEEGISYILQDGKVTNVISIPRS